MLSFVIALGAAGVTWFTAMWLFDVNADRNKTEIQRRREQIDYERIRNERGSWKDRVARIADTYGWEGGFTLPLAALGFIYLACVVGLNLVGFDGVVGAAIALPVAVGAVLSSARSARSRRKRNFNRQLVQALELFAAQLRAGAGPKRAIAIVADALPEPLRSEMMWVVAQTDTNRKLGDALADLQVRYPSKAMKLFVAAIRIDERQGAQIAPALEHAAETVRKEFELASEAQAELSQTRGEFYGIVAIMSFVVWLMIGNADETTMSVYRSPSGILWLTAGVANFLFGVSRVIRVLNKARGEV